MARRWQDACSPGEGRAARWVAQSLDGRGGEWDENPDTPSTTRIIHRPDPSRAPHARPWAGIVRGPDIGRPSGWACRWGGESRGPRESGCRPLAPGARPAGPRGSCGRGGGRPGAGHGRAATPTGPESRTGVSRPDAPTRLAVRVRRERTPRLAPGRPGYATRKATPPREQAGRGAAAQPTAQRHWRPTPPGTPSARATIQRRHRPCDVARQTQGPGPGSPSQAHAC